MAQQLKREQQVNNYLHAALTTLKTGCEMLSSTNDAETNLNAGGDNSSMMMTLNQPEMSQSRRDMDDASKAGQPGPPAHLVDGRRWFIYTKELKFI